MFDIGFWELLVIAVVALLVVGPERFPGVLRDAGVWLRRARQFASSVKTEFEREVNKAEELKRLMAREADIAEQHKSHDPNRPTIPANLNTSANRATGGGDAPSETKPDTSTDQPPDAPSR